MSAAATLRRVRQVRAARTGAGAVGISRYTLYLAAMFTVVVVAPILRALVLALAEPRVLAVLQAPAAGAVVSSAVGAALAGMLLLGRVRGPALLSPFLTVAVAGNDLPRHTTLRRPFLVASAGVVGVLLAGSTLVVAVRAASGGATVSSSVAFVAGMVAVAVLLAVAWLAGQRLARRTGAIVAAVIAGATALGVVIPATSAITPWGWAGMLYAAPTGSPVWLGLLGLAALGIAVLVTVRSLLNGLHGGDLLEQARRWQAAGDAGASGDLGDALARFRALPSSGRRRQAVRRRPLAVTFLLRDVVGALRTPGRFAVALLGLVGSGFALASVGVVPDAVGWLPAVTGAALAYLALGVCSDGFRHGAETAGQAAFYGVSGARLLTMHAALPILSTIVAVGAGGGIAAARQGTISGLLVAVAGALFLVSMRLYDAAKGPLPPSLLLPIPTPAGDASGLLVASWQADALLAGVAVVAVVAVAAVSMPWVVLALVPAAALAMLLTRSRLRR